MKEEARIQSAIDLLDKIEAGRIPMDNTIRDFMAVRRYIGSKDRTAIVERVYDVMRAKARLGWWLEQAGLAEGARSRVLVYLALTSENDADKVFNGEKHAPAPLTEPERRAVEVLRGCGIEDPRQPEAVRGECPDWAEPMLRTLYGETFLDQMRAMIDPAPLDLRVNTLKGSKTEIAGSLEKDGIKTTPTPYSPWGLRANGKPFMSESKAFRGGMVDIQDEGSQLIALVSGAAPGMRILDFCAGGGGKTLALAAMTENKGNIVAMDNDSRRLEKGRPRFRKAGVHNVELRSLEDEQHRKWLRRQKGTMDVVLVDAPCSSSGTWRRNPDLRWRFYGPSLEEIIALQAQILDKVADKVKPGGRLVYATCSLFREENEAQVEGFIARHPDFDVLPLSKAWPLADIPPPCVDPYLRLTPKDHQTDGFFAAVLVRKPT